MNNPNRAILLAVSDLKKIAEALRKNEEHELAEKVFRLNRFILRSSIYEGLPQDEKDRMVRQLQAMVAYQTVLGERLAAAKAGG